MYSNIVDSCEEADISSLTTSVQLLDQPQGESVLNDECCSPCIVSPLRLTHQAVQLSPGDDEVLDMEKWKEEEMAKFKQQVGRVKINYYFVLRCLRPFGFTHYLIADRNYGVNFSEVNFYSTVIK